MRGSFLCENLVLVIQLCNLSILSKHSLLISNQLLVFSKDNLLQLLKMLMNHDI